MATTHHNNAPSTPVLGQPTLRHTALNPRTPTVSHIQRHLPPSTAPVSHSATPPVPMATVPKSNITTPGADTAHKTVTASHTLQSTSSALPLTVTNATISVHSSNTLGTTHTTYSNTMSHTTTPYGASCMGTTTHTTDTNTMSHTTTQSTVNSTFTPHITHININTAQHLPKTTNTAFPITTTNTSTSIPITVNTTNTNMSNTAAITTHFVYDSDDDQYLADLNDDELFNI